MTGFWPTEYAELDFALPDEFIAKLPVQPADHARLLVVDRATETLTHDHFYNLGKYLAAGDAIFYNATRVEQRRSYLKKPDSEKRFECVFLKIVPETGAAMPRQVWQVLMRNIRRLKDGAALVAVQDESYKFTLRRRGEGIFLESDIPLGEHDFVRIGEMPIPPYMRRAATAGEAETYQNFFRNQIEEKEKIAGSAASPTAALHFTPALFENLKSGGVGFYPVCLDIGYGTFAPLTAANFENAKLHSEHYYIPAATAEKLRDMAGRRVALGTTSLRALLSLQHYGTTEGETEIFVKPGDVIAGVEGLITNFHLPQSSLILLTAAFCGTRLLAHAYSEAMRLGYRFYSYGDAMLII